MIMIEIDKLFETMVEFIDYKLSNTEEDQQLEKYLNRINYLKDHCTYQISLPRRNGNSTLALKLFDKYENSIYVVSRQVKKLETIKRSEDITTFCLFDGMLRGRRDLDLLIIDECKDLKEDVNELIYKNLALMTNCKCIIKLG